MKDKLTFSSLLLLALFSALAPALASTTWYVSGANGNDANNCLSPTTACKTIGHAISLAASGDSIMVAAATYGGNLTISKSLNIIGSSAQTTIIDGGGHNTVVTISNSAARVTLSHLTIRHGNAPTGGGIYNSGALTINNCVISGNSANANPGGPPQGGGIYSAGTLTINNSTISGNTAEAPPGRASARVIAFILQGAAASQGATQQSTTPLSAEIAQTTRAAASMAARLSRTALSRTITVEETALAR